MANFLGTWSANPESGTQFGYIRIGAGKLPRVDLRRTARRAFFNSSRGRPGHPRTFFIRSSAANREAQPHSAGHSLMPKVEEEARSLLTQSVRRADLSQQK